MPQRISKKLFDNNLLNELNEKLSSIDTLEMLNNLSTEHLFVGEKYLVIEFNEIYSWDGTEWELIGGVPFVEEGNAL